MVEINTSKPVLVTGATGYVAGWIVKGLLEKGITVYAAIRDVDDENKRQHLDKIANESNGNIKYFETNCPKTKTFYANSGNFIVPSCQINSFSSTCGFMIFMFIEIF